MSIWRRRAGALSYDMLGLHRLVPPPARGAGAAAPVLLACAAGAWVRGGSVAQQATVVAPAGAGAGAPGAAAFAAARNTAPGAATMQVAGSGWGSSLRATVVQPPETPFPAGAPAQLSTASVRIVACQKGGRSQCWANDTRCHSKIVVRHSHRSRAWPGA